jgi:hypothetical protein
MSQEQSNRPQEPQDRKKGNRLPRPSLPPAVMAQAREIAARYEFPLSQAIRIAKGELALSDAIQAVALKEKVARLKSQGQLDPRFSLAVLSGKMELDRALFETRLARRKQEADYARCHFDDYPAGGEAAVGVAAVGGRLLTGSVVEHLKYEVRLQTGQGDPELLPKHDIKLYFDAREKKNVLKVVTWGKPEQPVAAGALRDRRRRTKVKARVFLQAMEAGRAVTWTTVEEDQVRGRVVWLGRFEVVLETAKGLRVVMMRHAVRSVQ